MWVVAFMAALMLGTVMSIDSSVEPDEDTVEDADDAAMDPDPIVPIDLEETAGDADERDTDTDVDDPDPEEEETAPAGLTLVYNNEETITGGEGDDTLAAAAEDDPTVLDITTQIDLLGGNDFAELSLDDLTVNAADGDDTIIGLASGATILGGAGDDVISASGGVDLQGEAGNDTLSLTLSDTPDLVSLVSGGEGDDLIEIAAAIGADTSEAESVEATGGAGADTFDLELTLSDQTIAEDGPTTVESNSNISILDFDPAEDILQIEITRPDGAEDREIADTTLTRMDADETNDLGPYTEITLTFAGSDTLMEVTSTITVYSAEPFTVDDIAFVEAAA
ncbi:hypothetical protein [Planktotalea sp.]|uniref:hypothetical protein n=1 Tax=Planktotalea sp. TaxID=2029877 RepID=UPI003D6C455D